MEQKNNLETDQDKAVEFQNLKDLLHRNFAEIENLSLGNISTGITTSFYNVDAMTQVLRRGDFIAFAGRPSM